jgi:hypothetical protein
MKNKQPASFNYRRMQAKQKVAAEQKAAEDERERQRKALEDEWNHHSTVMLTLRTADEAVSRDAQLKQLVPPGLCVLSCWMYLNFCDRIPVVSCFRTEQQSRDQGNTTIALSTATICCRRPVRFEIWHSASLASIL